MTRHALPVPLPVKDIPLLPRGDDTANLREDLLVGEFVQGEEGHLVEDIPPDL